MNKVLKSFQECADIAKEATESKCYDCYIQFWEKDCRFLAYSVSIAHRDLLFFSNQGTVNYVVDTIGFKDYLSLVNLELDTDVIKKSKVEQNET